MTSDINKSQEIHVTGGFVLPRKWGLGAVWAGAGLIVALVSYGVRAETRLVALEDNAPRDRMERMERMLCLICLREPDIAEQCRSVCEVSVRR